MMTCYCFRGSRCPQQRYGYGYGQTNCHLKNENQQQWVSNNYNCGGEWRFCGRATQHHSWQNQGCQECGQNYYY